VPGPAGDATDLQSAGAKQTSSLDDSDLDLPAKYHMHWWDLAKRKSIRTLRDKSDPSLNMTLVSIGSSVSTPFTQDAWERHRSVRRYFANLVTIRTSTVFRRIYKPFMVLSLVATALTVWNGLAPSNLPRLQLAATAHNLLGAAISLLLVFRTNASYGRFQEARKLWGGVVKYSRDGVRLGAAYCSRDVLARLAAYLQAFAWTLKAQLRKGRTRTDPADPTAYKVQTCHVPRSHSTPCKIRSVPRRTVPCNCKCVMPRQTRMLVEFVRIVDSHTACVTIIVFALCNSNLSALALFRFILLD